MLISLIINNYQIFNQEVEFSMSANMHIKHFLSSIYKFEKLNILKSAILLGPNNAGKTCFIRAIKTMKSIMLNQNHIIQSNIFSNDDISEMTVSFLEDKHEYCFSIKYDIKKKEYIYEYNKREYEKDKQELNISAYKKKSIFKKFIDKIGGKKNGK